MFVGPCKIWQIKGRTGFLPLLRWGVCYQWVIWYGRAEYKRWKGWEVLRGRWKDRFWVFSGCRLSHVMTALCDDTRYGSLVRVLFSFIVSTVGLLSSVKSTERIWIRVHGKRLGLEWKEWNALGGGGGAYHLDKNYLHPCMCKGKNGAIPCRSWGWNSTITTRLKGELYVAWTVYALADIKKGISGAERNGSGARFTAVWCWLRAYLLCPIREIPTSRWGNKLMAGREPHSSWLWSKNFEMIWETLIILLLLYKRYISIK